MKPTIGSLFAGIGGFDLGFERAGFETVWQVEINDYCRKVLAKNFPHAERFGDIRECGKHNLRPVNVIAGGFPCQDISVAGPGHGIDGARSGLWGEMLRIICELRPRFVVVENVAALLGRGMGRVVGDLAKSGYDCEWQCVPALFVGLPHFRERIWIVAYSQEERVVQGWTSGSGSEARFPLSPGNVRVVDWREAATRLRGMDHGIPNRLDRGGALGNAIVPSIAELFANRIWPLLMGAE